MSALILLLAPPDPVLRYPLLPGVADEVAGNAATHYNEAASRLKMREAANRDLGLPRVYLLELRR